MTSEGVRKKRKDDQTLILRGLTDSTTGRGKLQRMLKNACYMAAMQCGPIGFLGFVDHTRQTKACPSTQGPPGACIVRSSPGPEPRKIRLSGPLQCSQPLRSPDQPHSMKSCDSRFPVHISSCVWFAFGSIDLMYGSFERARFHLGQTAYAS